MPIREDQLNGRIATIMRECVRGTHWVVAEENDGTLSTCQSTARHPHHPASAGTAHRDRKRI